MVQKSLYAAENGQLVRWEVPLRELAPNEVRVKIHSVGINPIDWKTVDFHIADGTGQGCDFSGTVTEIGSEVKSTQIGDTVAGGVGGGDVFNKENGSFTEILNVDEKLLFKFPKKLVPAKQDTFPPAQHVSTFEQAASLGIACNTAAIALDQLSPKSNDWALIYGVTSSLGYISAQFAKNIGFNVIGVSAPNPELINELGIHFIDRNDKDWLSKARELSNDQITFAYDTIGKDNSGDNVVDVVSKSRGGRASFNDPSNQPTPEVVKANPKVELNYPMYFLLMQEAKKFGPTLIPKDEHLFNSCGAIVENINKMFSEDKFRTLAIKVIHGLDKLNEALGLNRAGVHGTKIVINVE